MLEDKLARHERIRLEALNQSVAFHMARPSHGIQSVMLADVLSVADKFEEFIYEGVTERTDDESE